MIKVYSRTPLNKPVIYTIFSNPIGLTGLVATSNGLILIINNLKNESSIKQHLSLLTNAEIIKQPSDFTGLVKQFSLYFKGSLKTFNFPLDLSLGTPFQQKVWKNLLTIPYGKTRSYKWLASRIKNHQASRAVGNANGKNPLPIIIPCHRIIRKNGDLGGYTGGIEIKRFLLDLEQIN